MENHMENEMEPNCHITVGSSTGLLSAMRPAETGKHDERCTPSGQSERGSAVGMKRKFRLILFTVLDVPICTHLLLNGCT